MLHLLVDSAIVIIERYEAYFLFGKFCEKDIFK